jgi:hypothetical protein
MEQSKKTIEGYEVFHSIRLDGVDQIVAINTDAIRPYRLYECRRDNMLCAEEYHLIQNDFDYIAVMREFLRRLGVRLDSLHLDRVYRGTPLIDAPIVPNDCVEGGLDADLTGRVIAIRQDVLSPEFRACSHQLHLATGGSGCSPDARGRAVYCTNLYSGEYTRFAREDVLGVVADDSEVLPKWARDKLARLRDVSEKESVIAKIKAAKANPEPKRKPQKNHKPQEPER